MPAIASGVSLRERAINDCRDTLSAFGRIPMSTLSLIRDTRGATAIEYGLIAALIAIAAISAMKSLGTNLNSTFTAVSNNMKR